MSLARLLLSGLLVAAGLILGAFTLHGYFDPQWTENQAQAASLAHRATQAKSINVFQGRSRFVSRSERAASLARPQPPAANGVVSTRAVVKAADTKAVARVSGKRKAGETKKPPQQAALQWPWNLFSN